MAPTDGHQITDLLAAISKQLNAEDQEQKDQAIENLRRLILSLPHSGVTGDEAVSLHALAIALLNQIAIEIEGDDRAMTLLNYLAIVVTSAASFSVAASGVSIAERGFFFPRTGARLH